MPVLLRITFLFLQFSQVSLFKFWPVSILRGNGLICQSFQSSQSWQSTRDVNDVEKDLLLQIVKLRPKQVLSNELLSKEETIGVTVSSNMNVNNFILFIKSTIEPTLQTLSITDIYLWDSLNFSAPYKDSMKLSQLSDYVGSEEYPLVLTYVDHSVRDIKTYVKIVELHYFEDLTDDIISQAGDYSSTLPSNRDISALINDIKLSNPNRLGAVDSMDVKLLNSKNLSCSFDDHTMKLSELSEVVGSSSNPLVLACPDFVLEVASRFSSYLLTENRPANSSCVYNCTHTPIVSEYFSYVPRSEESSIIVELMRKRQLERRGWKGDFNLIHGKQLKSFIAGPDVGCSGDEKLNPIIVISGCPGIGKSSFLANFPNSDEFKNYLTDLCCNDKGVIVSTLTYIGDMKSEKDVTGLRLLFGSACCMSGVNSNSWRKFLAKFSKYRDLAAVYAIKVLKIVYGKSKRILVLADEIERAFINNRGENNMIHELGSALTSNEYDLIISAPSPQYVVSLCSASGRPVQHCIIPPIWNSSIGSVECNNWADDVIEALGNANDSNKDEFCYRLLRSMYLLASGHPRMLEFLVKSLKEKRTDFGNVLLKLGDRKKSVSSLLVDMAHEIESLSEISFVSLDAIDTNEILKSALSMKALDPFRKNQDFLRRQIESGRVMPISVTEYDFFPAIRIGSFIVSIKNIKEDQAIANSSNYKNSIASVAVDLFQDLICQPSIANSDNDKNCYAGAAAGVSQDMFSEPSKEMDSSSEFQNPISTWWERVIALHIIIHSFDKNLQLFGSKLPFLKFETTLKARLAATRRENLCGLNKDLLKSNNFDELIITPNFFRAMDGKVFIKDRVIYLQMKIAQSAIALKSLHLVFAKSTVNYLLHHHHYHPSSDFNKTGMVFYIWSDISSMSTKNSTKFLLSQCISNIKTAIDTIRGTSVTTDESIVSYLTKVSSSNLDVNQRSLARYVIESFLTENNLDFKLKMNDSQFNDITKKMSSFVNQTKRFVESEFDSNVDILNKQQLSDWLTPTFRFFPCLIEKMS